LLFTFLTAVFWFRERVRTNEVIGVLLLVAGIVVLLAT
jgi:multidrug transporter EmrE-like cation transporter